MQNHETNRSVLSFINFVSWVGIAAGVFLAIYAATNAPNVSFGGRSGVALTLMLPGMAIAFMGLFGVALSAVGVAALDTAQSNEELVSIMKRYMQQQSTQRDLASQAKPTQTAQVARPASASPPKPAPEKAAPPQSAEPTKELTEPGEVEYRGNAIRFDGYGYFHNGIRFPSLAKAKAHVDDTALIAKR